MSTAPQQVPHSYTAKQREYIERLKARRSLLEQRLEDTMLRDTQEITKEMHALIWAIGELEETRPGPDREPLPVRVEGAKYFRKKPVIVSAIQWFKFGDHPGVGRFAGNPRYADIDKRKGQAWIYTLEGGHFVTAGDWIIEGVEGEFYPCKPDIFAKTYEPLPATEEDSR